jgi:hypothetical protein
LNKESITALLKSVIITGAIAYAIAFAISGNPLPVRGFAILFFGQFIVFQIIGLVADRILVGRAITQASEDQTAIIQNTIGKQSLTLDCAYCNMVNQNVPVILSQENSFKCFNCNQENSILMKFYAARRTQPLEVPTLSANG